MKNPSRAPFLDGIRDLYNIGRNVVLLTGDTEGPFWDEHQKSFLSLERMLHSHMRNLKREDGEEPTPFAVVRFDGGRGAGFLDDESREYAERIYSHDPAEKPDADLAKAALDRAVKLTANMPLAGLQLLNQIFQRQQVFEKHDKGKALPFCAILQYSDALFPAGEFGHMSDLQWQRIVEFLNWITSPCVEGTENLVILIADTKGEVNQNIFQCLNTGHVEIQGPDEAMRLDVIDRFCEQHKGTQTTGVRFEGGREGRRLIARESSGLTTAHLFDILRVSHRTRTVIKPSDVRAKVNEVMQTKLGDFAVTKRPSHGPDDVIDYAGDNAIFAEIFENCEDTGTAPSAVIISGPNGVGKTFKLEAFAGASGRLFIELPTIRSSFYGGTDKIFDQFRWYLRNFGQVAIGVDEAHTAIGSVHKADQHETERRLGGNILKMMSDEDFRGRVIWLLMTSRPDELDPDIISRSPEQIAIFDPTPEQRPGFVEKLFALKKVSLGDHLAEVVERTQNYSARDYADLIRKVKSRQRKDTGISVPEVLSVWKASNAITDQRRFQTLVGAKFCAYPHLIPPDIRKLMDDGSLDNDIGRLRLKLRY